LIRKRPKKYGKVTHLGLLCLLFLLFSLSLGDGSSAGLCPGGFGEVAAGGDGGEISADDTTLVLDGLARALLGDLLGDALLVHLAVDYRPSDLAGVLALHEEGGILGACEAEDLISR